MGKKRAGALLVCVLSLGGCASMPDSGEVRRAGGEKLSDSDSQVRVFGVEPQKGEDPKQIVRGFLEATTSDEARYGTAKKYLTKSLGATWDPFARVTVLAGGPSLTNESAGDDGRVTTDTAVVSLAGQKVASVDRKSAYTAAEGPYRTPFRLKKEAGEWRIDGVEDGLVLSRSDFRRIYRSVNMYFYADLGQDARISASRRDVLVPDPVYLRRRIDPLASTVKLLLGGPTNWLAPVADTAFPAGAVLASEDALSLDDAQNLRIRFGEGTGAFDGGRKCERMAAQLLHTVQGRSTNLRSVEIQDSHGDSMCTLNQEQGAEYAPARLTGPANQQFFIDSKDRLVALSGDEPDADPVDGPFGEAGSGLRSVAVKRDEQVAAGVGDGGRVLYVSTLAETEDPSESVLSSEMPAPQGADEGLSAPSWDGYGDLWVADRTAEKSRLLMLRGGGGEPVEVGMANFAGKRIESLRVAADGVRIALRVHMDGRTVLQLGRIERTGTVDDPEIAVTELRTVTTRLEDVAAASWAGDSRLALVGREAGGVSQIQYVNTDGSLSSAPAVPGISNITAVAASENQDRPLLATLNGSVYRLPPDANWKRVTPEGGSPVYPG